MDDIIEGLCELVGELFTTASITGKLIFLFVAILIIITIVYVSS